MAKRKKKRSLTRYKSFEARLERKALDSGQNVVIRPSGEQKMSEVLLDFIDPYSEEWHSKDEIEKLLSVAIIAWNASLLDIKDREKLIRDTAEVLSSDLREEMKDIVKEMIQRKEKYFAGNRRLIVDYELTMTRTGPHVVVASTPALQ